MYGILNSQLIFSFVIIGLLCFLGIRAWRLKQKWIFSFAFPIFFTSLIFENIGVMRGVYYYPNWPLYMGSVPPIIPLGWIIILYFTYSLAQNRKNKILYYFLIPFLFDFFILEPLAIEFNLWVWKNPINGFIAPLSNYAYWVTLSAIYLELFSICQLRIRNDLKRTLILFTSFNLFLFPLIGFFLFYKYYWLYVFLIILYGFLSVLVLDQKLYSKNKFL